MSHMAPIVLFGYDRPDHMRQALEHLARADGASDSPMWIFCDGPKPGADLARIAAVRALANEPEWTRKFASVRVEVSERNKGLACSIIGGVSTVMDALGRAIVVEDDVLVAPDFLRFMNDCLDFYQADQTVGSVTGFSPLADPPAAYTRDVVAIPRNCSQCWATWADRWQQVDWDAKAAANLLRDPALRRRFNAAGNDRFNRLQRQIAGKIDSWSIRFGLWQTLSGRHTIYPVLNRVRNIGYDGSGVHTRSGQDVNARAPSHAWPYRLEPVTPDPAIVRHVARIYGGPWHKRVLRELRGWLRTRRAGT